MKQLLHDAEVGVGVALSLAEVAGQFRNAQDPDLTQSAQLAVMDTLACIIAGARDEAVLGVSALAHSTSGKCTVFGQNERRSASDAALINATAAHALDFDDACTTALGHTSAVLVPALIALAEAEDVSGTALIDAFIVGVEVQDRLGRIFNPEHYAAGWHSTATLCALGAAAGCAHLLGLNAREILAAMSNCTSMAGGSKKQIGSPMKPIHAGLAARSAVEAALLARAGIAGDDEPLAGAWGMLRQFNANPDAARVAAAMKNLRVGDALRTGVLQKKRFPCCAATHKSLDGVLSLRSDNSIDAPSVVLIETWVPADLAANLRYHHPASISEARFSMAYCATRIIDTGSLRLSDFTQSALARFGTMDWLSRVKMHTVENGDDPMGSPVRTRITMTSGKQIEITVENTKGSTEDPLTLEEIEEKFIECCIFAGHDKTEAIRWSGLIQSLPATWKIRDMMSAMQAA